jgi:predicted RNase H-like HicB family nuclease
MVFGVAQSMAEIFDHIRVLLLYDRVAWVAISLEFDIVSQGDTPEEALEDWQRLFEREILIHQEHGQHITEIPNSPQSYADAYDKSPLYKTLADAGSVQKLDVRITTEAVRRSTQPGAVRGQQPDGRDNADGVQQAVVVKGHEPDNPEQ